MNRRSNSDAVTVNCSLSTPQEVVNSFESVIGPYSSLTNEDVSKELRALISYGQLTPDAEALLVHLLRLHYTPKPELAAQLGPGDNNCILDFIPLQTLPQTPSILFVKRDPTKQQLRVYWSPTFSDDRAIYIARFDGDLKPCFNLEENDPPNGPPKISKEDLANLMYQDILKFCPEFVPVKDSVISESLNASNHTSDNWSINLYLGDRTNTAGDKLLAVLKEKYPDNLAAKLVNDFFKFPISCVSHSNPVAKTNYLTVLGTSTQVTSVQWGDLIDKAREW